MALENYRFVGSKITLIISKHRSNITVKYRHFALLNMAFPTFPF